MIQNDSNDSKWFEKPPNGFERERVQAANRDHHERNSESSAFLSEKFVRTKSTASFENSKSGSHNHKQPQATDAQSQIS